MPQVTIDVPERSLALLLQITDAMGILKEDVIINDESPDWHMTILNDRMEKYQGGKTSTSLWEDFEKELNEDETNSL